MSERSKIDFVAIKHAAPIMRVAEQVLNLSLKRDKDGFRCPCPIHEGHPRGMRITPDYPNKDGTKGRYTCFTCDQSGKTFNGDVIAMYAHCMGLGKDFYGAAQALSQHFRVGGKPARADERIAAPVREQQPANGLQPLTYLEPQHEVLDLLGLSQEVCEALGAGFAPKGTIAGRIAIPLRLPSGELVGYFSIATKPDQAPLLKFPTNLADFCGAGGNEREAEPEPPKTKDELRRLLRVV